MRLDKSEDKSDADNSDAVSYSYEEVSESDDEGLDEYEMDEYEEDYPEYSEYEDAEEDDTPAASPSSSGYVNYGGNNSAVNGDDESYSDNSYDDYSYSADSSSGTVNGDSDEVDYSNMDNVDSDDESTVGDDESDNSAVSPTGGDGSGSGAASGTASVLTGPSVFGMPQAINPLEGYKLFDDFLTDEEKSKIEELKFTNNVTVHKYAKDGKMLYAIPGFGNDAVGRVDLTAETLDELKKLQDLFNEVWDNHDFTKIKELLAATKNNKDMFIIIANKLRENISDDETWKNAVKEMLKTKDADVIRALIPNEDTLYGIVKDEATAKFVAGLFKEIRDKEKAGSVLSANDLSLKSVLKNALKPQNRGQVVFFTSSEDNIGMYVDNDGNIVYEKGVGTGDSAVTFSANSKANLNKIIKDYETAMSKSDTDEDAAQTKALIKIFDTYAKCDDEALKVCLAENVDKLKVDEEHLKAFVKKSNLKVLTSFRVDSLNKLNEIYPGIKDAIKKEIQDRVKDIYTKDKGNLENLIYLDRIIKRDGTEGICEFDNSTMKSIVESYFTKDSNGEYTFTPKKGQRPTFEQMDELAKYIASYGGHGLYDKNNEDENKTRLAMNKALVKHVIKCGIETMGEGQFSEAVERWCDSATIKECYMEVINEMSSSELVDFIENKMSRFKTMNIDFDKILEKHKDDADVIKALVKTFGSDNAKTDTISSNALNSIVNYFMSNGAIDESKLNAVGISDDDLFNMLPDNSNDESVKNAVSVIIKGKEKVDDIVKYKNKNKDAVKERLVQLVNSNITAENLKKIAQLESDLIPVDQIFGNGESANLKQCVSQLSDSEKQLLFKALDGKISKDKVQPYMQAAISLGIAKSYDGSSLLYIVGDKYYDMKPTYNDNTICMKEYNVDSYCKGIFMYNDVNGPGSGDIEKKLADSSYMNPNNIRSVIRGFNDKSPKENIIQYLTNDDIKQSQVNEIVKALLKRAYYIMENNNVDENFQAAVLALVTKFGVQKGEKQNDGYYNITFTQNNSSSDEFEESTAKLIDEMINELCAQIHKYEWYN